MQYQCQAFLYAMVVKRDAGIAHTHTHTLCNPPILHMFSSQPYYPTPLAEQLWDSLVLQPAHPSDEGQGL